MTWLLAWVLISIGTFFGFLMAGILSSVPNKDEPMSLRAFQGWIGNWNSHIFGNCRDRYKGLYKHLQKEVKELGLEIMPSDAMFRARAKEHGRPCIRMENIANECADVFILLCALSHNLGIDLDSSVKEKMAINSTRKWKKPNKDGVIEHKK